MAWDSINFSYPIYFSYSQESLEGNRMLDFRRSLPTFKEKERLLQAIARNQVWLQRLCSFLCFYCHVSTLNHSCKELHPVSVIQVTANLQSDFKHLLVVHSIQEYLPVARVEKGISEEKYPILHTD